MGVATLGVLLLVAQTGQSGLTFRWAAPPSCPPESSVRSRLGDLVGSTSVTITAEGGQWQLEVVAADSVRRLATSTCEEAADAAVLIIQLALNGPTTTPPPPPPDARAPLTPPELRWAAHARALGGVTVGWLPLAMPRAGAALELQRGPVVVGLEGTFSTPQRIAGGPTATAAVDVQVPLHLQLDGCWRFALDRFGLGPCVVGALSLFSAEGLNVSNAKKSTVVVWSGGAGLRASFQLTSWLELVGTGAVRLGSRPSIYFEGFPAFAQAGAISGDLLLGLGASW
jgi:hypothetical protein